MSKKERGFFQFILGIISGLALGLLLAPKPGKDMRENLTSKSKKLKEFTKDKIEEFQQISKGKAVEMAGNIQTRANKISSKLDELARRGTDILIQDEVQ